MLIMPFRRQRASASWPALALLAFPLLSVAVDTYNGTDLTCPTVNIGAMTFSGMVVTNAGIVSYSSGTASGSSDSYDPGSNQLTIPAVTVGTTTYDNVVISVASLVSIGGVTGADTYANGQLTIPSVQLPNGKVYSDVIITVRSIVSRGGGMPQHVRDVYDPATQQLTIAAIQYGGTVYTNAIVTLGTLIHVGPVATLVPNVVGDSQTVAQSALAAAGLTVGAITQASSATVPVGDVISESPAAGAVVSNGAPVSLTVSSGSNAYSGYAYVSSNNDSTISQYGIAASGQLVPLSPATVVAGGNPTTIAASVKNSAVYTPDSSNSDIFQFGVGAGGGLVPLSPASVTTGSSPSDQYPAGITADPSGSYLFVADGNGAVSQYTIGALGAVTPLNPASFYIGGRPSGITFDPQGLHAYVLDGYNGLIYQYRLGAGGTLTALSPATVSTGTNPQRPIVIDPTGSYAYVANYSDFPCTVSQYTVGAGGVLTPMSTPKVPTTGNAHAWAAAVDPSGRYVYVTGTVVSQFSIGAGGALVPMTPATVSAGIAPTGVAFDPSGQYVYVVNLDNTISEYSIGSGGGLVPLSPASVRTGARTYEMAVIPAQ